MFYKNLPVYVTVDSIIRRCHSETKDNYHKYGGKGIFVCEEWRNNRSKFCQWLLDNGYKQGLQVDRIDNEKGYSPDNCRIVHSALNNMNKVGSNRLGVCGIIYKQDSPNRSFSVSVTLQKKSFVIGNFATLLDAVAARKGFTNKLIDFFVAKNKEKDYSIQELEDLLFARYVEMVHDYRVINHVTDKTKNKKNSR